MELPGGVVNDDRVTEGSAGVYVQYTDYVNDWFRFILGAREDYFEARDSGTNAGSANATIFQPKGSVVFTPFSNWEFYVSAGRGFHSNDFRGVTTGGAFLVPATGEEIGIRATPSQEFTATLTLYHMEFRSELTYDADAGATSAGRPSRRTGVELNATYSPFDWLEVYGSVAFAHGRYTDDDPAGDYIPDAPNIIGQLGIYVRDLDHWFGALDLRYLGKHPLIEDNSRSSPGYQEWNLNIGYDFGDGLKAQMGVFNLFDSQDDAADYYYADRISPTEPLIDPSGNPDLHLHPLEPRAFRFTVSKTF
jgi:outer membrane receptor protein involved in Fe transport